MREVDAYIRFKRANLVMNAILRYPVDVFGTGWDHVNWDGAAAQCHGAMTWRTMIDQLPRYVGSLSINPLVEESVHDRVFFALAAGVVPVTDGNAFTDENMPALESYRFSFVTPTDRASGGSRSGSPRGRSSLGSKIPGARWRHRSGCGGRRNRSRNSPRCTL